MQLSRNYRLCLRQATISLTIYNQQFGYRNKRRRIKRLKYYYQQ